MNKSELVQIIIGILGLVGSWKLSQWWLIVVVSILILCVPFFKWFKSKNEKKQYKKVEKREILSIHDIIKAHNPNLTFSRDSLAISQGLKTPRHIEHLSRALYYNQYLNAFQTLEGIINETHNHINQEIKFL